MARLSFQCLARHRMVCLGARRFAHSNRLLLTPCRCNCCESTLYYILDFLRGSRTLFPAFVPWTFFHATDRELFRGLVVLGALCHAGSSSFTFTILVILGLTLSRGRESTPTTAGPSFHTSLATLYAVVARSDVVQRSRLADLHIPQYSHHGTTLMVY